MRSICKAFLVELAPFAYTLPGNAIFPYDSNNTTPAHGLPIIPKGSTKVCLFVCGICFQLVEVKLVAVGVIVQLYSTTEPRRYYHCSSVVTSAAASHRVVEPYIVLVVYCQRFSLRVYPHPFKSKRNGTTRLENYLHLYFSISEIFMRT